MDIVSVRRAINWANLSTPLGVLVAKSGRAKLSGGPHGLILAADYRARFPAPNAPAVTIGDVVLLRMDRSAALANPALLRHEARHSAQYARWVGLFGFLPAYLSASVWSWWHTGDFAIKNRFEIGAGLVDGGYVAAPSTEETSIAKPDSPPESAAPGLI